MGFCVDEITGSRRSRRSRRFDWSRRLVRENRLSVDDLVWPIFVTEDSQTNPIAAMPSVMRFTVDDAIHQAKYAADLNIPAIAIFPNICDTLRDQTGSNILHADNLINRVTRAIKDAVPHIGVITDVALDPFTDHAHDGVLRDGEIVNDETVAILAEAAVLQANAGADIIAPSDMMDGRIGAIRRALDDSGHQKVAIMSYIKYASVFYGPYREAVGTGARLEGDKKTYYMDPSNGAEALRKTRQDLEEGADMILIKPGMPYLDIARQTKDHFHIPTFAYQVSMEYSMIMAADAHGWVDRDQAMMESLISFKRAGCDGIFTYFALRAAEKLAYR